VKGLKMPPVSRVADAGSWTSQFSVYNHKKHTSYIKDSKSPVFMGGLMYVCLFETYMNIHSCDRQFP